jgi:hypothetical protein
MASGAGEKRRSKSSQNPWSAAAVTAYEEGLMPLFGDHYAGDYEGHTLELIRNNWDKTLKLLIDGDVVASTTCHLPRRITLTAALKHKGVRHKVMAKSIPRYVIFTVDMIGIDGLPLSLLHEAPKGITPWWAIVLMAVSGVAILAAGGGALIAWLR